MCNNESSAAAPFQFKLMMSEAPGQAGQAQQAPPGLLPLDHYRLQLYNYAVHAERLRSQQFLPVFSPYPPHPRLLSMSLLNHRLLPPEEPKPQHSYIGLIAMAILSSPDLKLVLSDIYQYILDHYPYFRTRGPGWRNSIRHNLSLNDCFVKAGRSANGKGHYWAIHPANVEDFKKGDFRRRKAQRKVRKHMGLAVDDDGNDSPSPPPMTMTPPPTTLWPPVSPIVFPVPPSVTRKRQFDVASLLAPDEDPLSKRLTLTPYSSDEEDIDVVSSDKTPATPQATQTSWFRPPVFAEHQQLVARYYEQLAAHSRRVQTPLVSGSPPLDHEPST